MERQWTATQWSSPEEWEFREIELAAPGPGEVTIRVHAAGVNPADAKHVAAPRPGVELPVPIGYEVSGVIEAIGPDTEIASGPASVGDEVLAFRVEGGYATALTVPSVTVLGKPAGLRHEEAANLLLAGTTAAQMLDVTGVHEGVTILLHGASGAVGVSVIQQARLLGARVIGTVSPRSASSPTDPTNSPSPSHQSSFERVAHFGGEAVAYGPGLADRVRELAPEGIFASLDAVGTDEAVEVSLELVADRNRIVTIAAFAQATREGFPAIAGAQPESAAFRDAARSRLIALAADGRLVVPIARTYPLAEAREAVRFLAEGHPGGKIALVP